MARAMGAPVVRPYRTPDEDRDAVALDLLARAAAVAELAAREVGVDRGRLEGEAGRAALEDGGELAAVRLAGGEVAQRRHARYLTRRAEDETMRAGRLRGRRRSRVAQGAGCCEPARFAVRDAVYLDTDWPTRRVTCTSACSTVTVCAGPLMPTILIWPHGW